jgi:hypothetical protein
MARPKLETLDPSVEIVWVDFDAHVPQAKLLAGEAHWARRKGTQPDAALFGKGF